MYFLMTISLGLSCYTSVLDILLPVSIYMDKYAGLLYTCILHIISIKITSQGKTRVEKILVIYFGSNITRSCLYI